MMKNIAAFIFCTIVLLNGCGMAGREAVIILADSSTTETILENTSVPASSENKTRLNRKDIDTFNYILDEIRNFKPPKLIEKK